MDIPLDFPWLRRPRVKGAIAGLGAATHRFIFERHAIAFGADTSYTRALASARVYEISRLTTRDADSLVTLARVRRDAGDGTELDVQLAIVNAGQLANQASRDSLDAVLALLSLQSAIGLRADEAIIALSDSTLVIPDDSAAVLRDPPARDSLGTTVGTGGTLLLVAAAEQDLAVAEFALKAERRRVIAVPALSFGFDTNDPSGAERGILPTIGLSIPLPLFNRNRASITAAQVTRDRVQAELTLARLDGVAQSARARLEYALARARVLRSQRLLDAANRVAALALLAYREGASALPNVMAVQRLAREALSQYVDDLAAVLNAAAAVRLLSITVNPASP